MTRMKLNSFPLFFARQYNWPSSNHPYFQIAAAILLSATCISGVTANPQPDKYYLRIAHGASTDTDDLSVTTLGVLSLKNNMVGHVDLNYLKSDMNGDALALDFGAGLAFNWYVSPYISIGASLGYNWDIDEAIAAYFPEVGFVADITKTFGIALSAKRYYSLYEEDDDVIMLGLVFRK